MFTIADSTFPTFFANNYTASFFSSGYEHRCTHAASNFDISRLGKAYALSFEELQSFMARSDNDKYFKSNSFEFVQLSTDAQLEIFNILNGFLVNNNDPVHLLVDYSSMSKLWLAAFVIWISLVDYPKDITIDFIYSAANHSPLSPLQIKQILPLPWFEGIVDPQLNSIAYFGLGFDGLSPLSVIETVAPDEVYTFYANPALNVLYPNITLKENKRIIDEFSLGDYPTPISSVSISYSILCEHIAQGLLSNNICIIPMGPKPLTLAALFVCAKFSSVTFLNVSGKRNVLSPAHPSGEFVCTSISQSCRSLESRLD